jgi:hypothetical protein
MSESGPESGVTVDPGVPFIPLFLSGAGAAIVALLFGGLLPIAGLLWLPALILPAFAIGSRVRRWWVVPIPLAIGLVLAASTDPCAAAQYRDGCDLGAAAKIATAGFGFLVSAGLLVGTIVGRQTRR